MPQNLTKPNISNKQEKAIELLITGETVTNTAKQIGVARETVSRWINHEAEFQAEFNTQRHDIWNSYQDRLRSLIPKAMDIVADELEAGNVQTALTILKMASFKPEPTGSISADSIEHNNSLNWGW
jgi:hypothetical protein